MSASPLHLSTAPPSQLRLPPQGSWAPAQPLLATPFYSLPLLPCPGLPNLSAGLVAPLLPPPWLSRSPSPQVPELEAQSSISKPLAFTQWIVSSETQAKEQMGRTSKYEG